MILNEVRTLQTNRTKRDRARVFYFEGVRNFVKAVDSGTELRRVIYSEKLLTNPLARKLVRKCRRSGVPTTAISPENFRRTSETKRASGIAAIATQPWLPLDRTKAREGLCWIVLQSVRSPGNTGTLIRTSAAIGGAGLILVGNRKDPFSSAVLRSAMGAVFQQAFVRTDWCALRDWAETTGRPVIGATPEGTIGLHEALTLSDHLLIVLGDERKGLSSQQKEICDTLLRIPMRPGTDSLNLGVAGSLILYEVLRQSGA